MKARVHHLIGPGILALALAVPALAGEYAVLDNGFRLHDDRHEQNGAVVRLYTGTGVVEMPAARISGFEAEDAPPAASPAPVTPAATQSAPAVMETAAELAHEAAAKLALPQSFESLVRSVMKAESAFNPAALSPKGAIGLMQLMPDTARELKVNPRVPRENADGGARYLRDLLARYEGKPDQVVLALAAYNAGPEAVEKYHGVPPFRETHDYILRVLKSWNPGEESRTNP
ncbi:MAG TPA: lytic transglycosylase domain-containing protein [Bryobacteraceae bacterium]|nr:lytic transglycosylase domain-containing protein [Bryobacteraceae bacterium]